MAQMTKQQVYLLQRLPKQYDLQDPKVVEPTEVKRSRKIIEAWEEKQSNIRRERKARFSKLLTSAREAVYFKPAEKALEVVKAIEAEFAEVLK